MLVSMRTGRCLSLALHQLDEVVPILWTSHVGRSQHDVLKEPACHPAVSTDAGHVGSGVALAAPHVTMPKGQRQLVQSHVRLPRQSLLLKSRLVTAAGVASALPMFSQAILPAVGSSKGSTDWVSSQGVRGAIIALHGSFVPQDTQ